MPFSAAERHFDGIRVHPMTSRYTSKSASCLAYGHRLHGEGEGDAMSSLPNNYTRRVSSRAASSGSSLTGHPDAVVSLVTRRRRDEGFRGVTVRERLGAAARRQPSAECISCRFSFLFFFLRALRLGLLRSVFLFPRCCARCITFPSGHRVGMFAYTVHGRKLSPYTRFHTANCAHMR